MNFEKLNRHIPYCIGDVEKTAVVKPYPYIQLLQPGRHQHDTVPIGGDFVVRVTDKKLGWREHEFSHRDIFNLIYRNDIAPLMTDYFRVVVEGQEPPKWRDEDFSFTGTTFLRAIQCLAVAEHRRYKQHEAKYGGRFLPFRFAAGIGEGLWTPTDANALERKGRPGVEYLESVYGVPILTKELFKNFPKITSETHNET